VGSTVKLILIAALSRNRVIGKDGKIPWHIPEDLKRFKELTTGHTVLMGRRTYESLGNLLPNRRNVVLTSRRIPGVETHVSLEAALQALKDEEKVFVIGGGTVFAQTLNAADELLLTIVDQEIDGDTFFPTFEDLVRKEFRLVNREEHAGYEFLGYERKKGELHFRGNPH